MNTDETRRTESTDIMADIVDGALQALSPTLEENEDDKKFKEKRRKGQSK